MKRPCKSDYTYYLSLSSGGTGIDYRAYSSALEEYVEWLRELVKDAYEEGWEDYPYDDFVYDGWSYSDALKAPKE